MQEAGRATVRSLERRHPPGTRAGGAGLPAVGGPAGWSAPAGGSMGRCPVVVRPPVGPRARRRRSRGRGAVTGGGAGRQRRREQAEGGDPEQAASPPAALRDPLRRVPGCVPCRAPWGPPRHRRHSRTDGAGTAGRGGDGRSVRDAVPPGSGAAVPKAGLEAPSSGWPTTMPEPEAIPTTVTCQPRPRRPSGVDHRPGAQARTRCVPMAAQGRHPLDIARGLHEFLRGLGFGGRVTGYTRLDTHCSKQCFRRAAIPAAHPRGEDRIAKGVEALRRRPVLRLGSRPRSVRRRRLPVGQPAAHPHIRRRPQGRHPGAHHNRDGRDHRLRPAMPPAAAPSAAWVGR